jgi:two-component system LytT family sensor kinase
MNRLKRTLFQVLTWLVIWCVVWIISGSDFIFIEANSLAFIFQIGLLFGVIYSAVPRFLFNKKYVLFVLLSICVISLCAYISAEFAPSPINRPPPDDVGGPPMKGPSRFFVHLLILSVSCITAVLLETFVYAQQKEKGIAFAKAELIESELKFLKMQINPHFLFNALNNIYALSVINSEKTQEGISTLSEMLRYVLYDCERPEVPLHKEVEYIKNFIELFKLKSSKKFNIILTEDLQNDTITVAPMLFVPFIENAFKHSGIEKRGDSFVTISLKAKENNIDFLIENSLTSEEHIIKDGQGGIGVNNVQKRLKLLYPENHKLHIEKTNIFRVHLNVNIK